MGGIRMTDWNVIGFLSVFLAGGARAQQVWSNAQIHPWATAMSCSGQTLVPTNGISLGCMDVWGFNTADGAPVNYYPCNGKNNQQWNIFRDLPAGSLKFINTYTRKCLDSWGGANGQQLNQYNCNTGTAANQKVYLEYVRAVTGCASDWSSYRIRFSSASSGMCLTVRTDSRLVFSPCSSNKAQSSQNFFIRNGGGATPVPSPTPTPAATYSGYGTYYNDAGLTSCGNYVPGDGMYAAISWPLSNALDSSCQSNPNRCSWCNRRARISGSKGSAVVNVIDKCESCQYGDIDMTMSAFQQVIGSLSIGRARVTWSFI